MGFERIAAPLTVPNRTPCATESKCRVCDRPMWPTARKGRTRCCDPHAGRISGASLHQTIATVVGGKQRPSAARPSMCWLMSSRLSSSTPAMSLISSSGTPAGCVREAGIRKWRFVPLTPGAQAQSTTGICRRVRHRICEQTPICRPRQCEIPSVPPARGEYCRHHERSCR